MFKEKDVWSWKNLSTLNMAYNKFVAEWFLYHSLVETQNV